MKLLDTPNPMRPVKVIKTEVDYEVALKEVSPYFDNPPEKNSLGAKRFLHLVNAIELYEEEHYPIGEAEDDIPNKA